MAVAEPLGAKSRDFNLALEQAWRQTAPLHIQDGEWELAVAGGRRLVRVSIGNRWWALVLNGSKWSRGRRAAYESIVSGKAVTGELLLYRRSTYGMCGQNRLRSDERLSLEIVCKTVAWLPRQDEEDSARLQSVLPAGRSRLDPGVRSRSIIEIEIGALREAIRANWVSFPSQVPVFPSCGLMDLQPRLVQLYFVFGWKCANIAARYGLASAQVRHILKAWRRLAANAGYIQHIPATLQTVDNRCSNYDLDRATQPEPGPGDAWRQDLGDERCHPFEANPDSIHTEQQNVPFRMSQKNL